MRITSKGQVTIPQHIREAAGLMPGTSVSFVWDGETVRLVPDPAAARRGAGIVARLRRTATVAMTTDQMMALTRQSE